MPEQTETADQPCCKSDACELNKLQVEFDRENQERAERRRERRRSFFAGAVVFVLVASAANTIRMAVRVAASAF